MAEFRPIIIGLLLTGLFAIALISSGILLASNNNAPQSIADDSALSYYNNSISSSLKQSAVDSGNFEESLSSSPVTLGGQNLVFDAIGGVWKSLKAMPVTIYNLTVSLLKVKIFGDVSFGIVFGTIGAILTITIGLAVWKLISTGESG